MTANPTTQGMRKAAILVASLDRSTVDLVLDQMEPQQAQGVRQAILELGPIDPEEQREIIAEFRRNRAGAPREPLPGVELAGELAQRFAPPRSDRPAPPAPASGPLFCFLRQAEVERVARVLAGERPQTIALVLAHMSPEHAGKVLARLDAAAQVEVVRRLADLEETDPEILREVERGLESRLAEQVPMQRRRVAGLSAVVGILGACDQQAGLQLLENISQQDRQLAEQLTPGSFEFADLVEADDDTLGTTLRAADPEWVMLALVGAPPEWIARFLTLVPESHARQVRRGLEHLGPTRLIDVEEARRRLADLARRLALQRRIRLPGTARWPLAA